MKSNKEFFDLASSFYNDMINFEDALLRREKGLSNFISSGMKNGADIGCGTGIDSIALSRNELAVTSFDTSGSMLEQAKHNAERLKERIELHQLSADKIPTSFFNKYQIVVSLGNTFANLNKAQLEKAVYNCFNMLTPGGIFLIQILNFRKIMKEKERIISISKGANYYYIRFYDFPGHVLNFNILKFDKEKPAQRELITTSLYPYPDDVLVKLLMQSGFSEINLYENFDRKVFNSEESKDLIMEAKK